MVASEQAAGGSGPVLVSMTSLSDAASTKLKTDDPRAARRLKLQCFICRADAVGLRKKVHKWLGMHQEVGFESGLTGSGHQLSFAAG